MEARRLLATTRLRGAARTLCDADDASADGNSEVVDAAADFAVDIRCASMASVLGLISIDM